ncbi:armadillo-type protein [Dipodascopsis tothii]|uniref:armadillo-type protein n=1 Tax=Dipodascopsis tothii TaxID=44089 RepID=UPI0034CFE53F
MASLTSSAALLALLDEPDQSLQVYALEKLNEVVDEFWTEITDSVTVIEELYEDDKFPQRKLAALIASKVYYNLGEFDSSMNFALSAGELFDLAAKSEYVETIVSKCIDTYIQLSQKYFDYPDRHPGASVDAALVEVVERMFQRCLVDGQYKHAIGVALEARRLDTIETCIKHAFEGAATGAPANGTPRPKRRLRSNTAAGEDLVASAVAEAVGDAKGSPDDVGADLLHYVFEASMSLVLNKRWRDEVLHHMVDLMLKPKAPDYFTVAKILIILNESAVAARILTDLAAADNTESLLTAYQIAFDLVSSTSQEFLQKVVDAIDPESCAGARQVLKILSGVPSLDIELTFLFEHNKTDLLILNKTKDTLEARNSIFHNAVTFENAFMHAGTTVDGFFRENLEWLSKATNWSKFSATAALGVIHKGNLSQGMNLLKPYLPGEAASTSSSHGSNYSQGGSLYALGLVFAGHGKEVLDYLRQHVRDGGNSGGQEGEVVQHGAALGVGVAGMATRDDEIYEELRNILFSDSAIAGEAAGLAMGLVMLGSGSEKALDEMLMYAHETQHEKIIRGLAVGIALIMYGKEEAADALIDQLLDEQDPILRYGGIFTIALAYCGTGNNTAIKRLLHVAVSDVNDDVRRAAVMSLGFILFRNPTAVPRMVELLSESYNPHVRYGAALALGISCAGTGIAEAADLLEPMLKDPTDFVRQGALISMAMIFVQQNEKMNPKVADIRATFAKVIGEKHEDAMAKFGAVLAQGIIDAGGRNVTISLENRQTGNLNMKAIVGMAMFTQFWYWFPLTCFLSLSFTPTMIVGVRQDLKIPKLSFFCNAKPAKFDYVPKTEERINKAVEKVSTAVLSTTARAKARARKTEKERAEKEGMDVDGAEFKPAEDAAEDAAEADEAKDDKMDVDGDATEDEDESDDDVPSGDEVKDKKEIKGYKLENMSRVLPAQLKYVTFSKDERFTPVKKFRSSGGILLLRDDAPGVKTEFIQTVRERNMPPSEVDDDEATLPEPFEYETDTEL